MTNTVKFPMNGFEDSCVGIDDVAEHGTNVLTDDGLCPSCTEILSKAVAGWREVKPTQCGNCKDHSHGSRYYDCMCCYGD
jgi:hypothetical protein